MIMNRLLLAMTLLMMTGIKVANAQKECISPDEYQNMLGRGLDVDWWGRSETSKIGDYSEAAVNAFAQRGVQHIRIRLHHYDVTAEDISRLKAQIMACRKAGMVPVVAFSAKPYKENPTEEEHEKVVLWWTNMAQQLKDEAPDVSFDLIIEPSDLLKTNPDELNAVYNHCVSAIRKTNPKRIIFIAPRNLSQPEGLQDLTIPDDGNGFIMAEWHFYAAGPDKNNPKKLWTTGTDEEKQLISSRIAIAKKWQQQTGIKTWVGAWMPGNYNKGDDYTVEEQMVFARFMCSELEAAGIPFAINADKTFYDYAADRWKAYYAPLLDIVFGRMATPVSPIISDKPETTGHFGINGRRMHQKAKGVMIGRGRKWIKR